MLHGSDNYPPIVLPPDAQVLRSDGGMDALQEYLKNRAPDEAADYNTYQRNRERLLGKVWERQFFAMLATLLLLFCIPLWESLIEPLSEMFGKTASAISTGSDGSSGIAGGLFNLFVQVGSGAVSLLGSVVGALKSVTPSYVAPYLESLHHSLCLVFVPHLHRPKNLIIFSVL